MTRKSNKRPEGQETRERIVDRALRLAAVKGLGGLSIGSLAQKLNMSKSGLFAHFGSKENLEIAVVERAGLLFFNHILPTEEDGLEGIERLWAVCENWLSFVEKGVLPGGYFFTGAFFQCAEQGGPIPRRITDIVRRWVSTLRDAVDGARSKGDFRSHVDARQTALELNGILIGVKCSYLLGHENRDSARSAILVKLATLATDEIPASAFESVKGWRDYLKSRHE